MIKKIFRNMIYKQNLIIKNLGKMAKKNFFSSLSARKLRCPSSARNFHSLARLEPENSSSGSSLLVGYLGSSGHDIRVPENPFHSICIACAIASGQTGRRQSAHWDKLNVWTVSKKYWALKNPFHIKCFASRQKGRQLTAHWDVLSVGQSQLKRRSCWILT